MASGLNKQLTLNSINGYLKSNLEKDKQRAIDLLIKADPKLRGLFINMLALKRLKHELKALMKTIAHEYSDHLKLILKTQPIKYEEILPAARAALKCHQKMIIANLIEHIRKKNPKLAQKLNKKIEDLPDLVLPTIRENNTKIFDSIKPVPTKYPSLFLGIRKLFRK